MVAGILFCLLMAILGFYTIIFKAERDGLALVYIPVRLPTAEGLSVGADVFLQGVRVGHIHSLHYMALDQQGWPFPFSLEAGPPSHGQTVIALLALMEAPRFYANYRIVGRYRTVLSDKVLELLPGGAADWFNSEGTPGRPYPWGEEAAPEGPIFYLQLDQQQMSRFREEGILPYRAHLLTASNYKDPLYLLAAVLAENRRPLYQFFDNLRQITEKINYGNGSIALFINQPDLAHKLNAILKEADLLAADARDGLENLRESRSALEFISLTYLVLAEILLRSLEGS